MLNEIANVFKCLSYMLSNAIICYSILMYVCGNNIIMLYNMIISKLIIN